MVRKLSVSLFLVLLLVAVLLIVQQATGLQAAADPRPGFLAAAVGTHFVSLLFMAGRLHLALGGSRRPFAPLLDMTVLHNFLLALLPARMADAYYPFLVAARGGGRLGAGVGNLVLLRLMDLAAITVILGLVLPWVVIDGLRSDAVAILAVGLLAVIVIVGLSLERLLGGAALLVLRFARRRPLARKLVRLLVQARAWVRGLSLARRLILFAVSLGLWTSSAMTYFVVLRGLGLDLDLARSVFAGQMAELGGAVPVQTIAGIGASEGLMTGILAAYGLPLTQAAVLAVWCRLTILGAVTTLFCLRSALVYGHQRATAAKGGDRPSAIDVLFGRSGAFAAAPPLETAAPDTRP